MNGTILEEIQDLKERGYENKDIKTITGFDVEKKKTYLDDFKEKFPNYLKTKHDSNS